MSPDEDKQDKPVNEQGPPTQQEQREELEKVVDNAQDVLIKAQSTFPFVLFPDTIAVSRMKVAIMRRMFFKTADVISLQHEDILNIEIDTGPFFGSLSIFTRIYGTDPLRINFLSRKSAIDVKRIIEGAIIAHQQNINTQQLEKGELITLLTRLGSDSTMM